MATPSLTAQRLISDYAGEVSDAREFPNQTNVERSKQALLDYVAALEEYIDLRDPRDLLKIKRDAKFYRRAFTGGGL